MRYYWPLVVGLLGLAALLLLGMADGMRGAALLKEGGPVETASVLAYVLAALGFCSLALRVALGSQWQITALFLLFAAREMDWDKAFIQPGILKSDLYLGPYPLADKLIGGAVIMLILIVVYRLVRWGTRPILTGLRHGAGWAWAAAIAVVTVVAAKSIDGADRKLEPYGIDLSEGAIAALGAAEEVSELALAFVLLFAVCQWASLQSR